VSDPRVRSFYDWLVAQPDAVLRESIVTVRAWYQSGEPVQIPDRSSSPAPTPERQADLDAYRQMLRSLVAKGESYAIKAATADRFLHLALQDDRKMELLTASPLRVRLVLAASLGDDRTEAAERLVVDVDTPSTEL
jgi:hypothetical protein